LSISVATKGAPEQMFLPGTVFCSTVDTATLDPGNSVTAAGIFHNYDYPFYYFDLRANAANRIKRYLAANR
jgi:hypothetical protein